MHLWCVYISILSIGQQGSYDVCTALLLITLATITVASIECLLYTRYHEKHFTH